MLTLNLTESPVYEVPNTASKAKTNATVPVRYAALSACRRRRVRFTRRPRRF
jgi:hypothetical protein